MSIQRREKRNYIPVVGIIGQRRGLGAAESRAAAVGNALRNDALQFGVVLREPRFDFAERFVARAGDAAQRGGESPLFDSDGAPPDPGKDSPSSSAGLFAGGNCSGIFRSPQASAAAGRTPPERKAATRCGTQAPNRPRYRQQGPPTALRSRGPTARRPTGGCRAAGRGFRRTASGNSGWRCRCPWRSPHRPATSRRKPDRNFGINLPQHPDDIFRQHPVLGRRLHQTAMAGGQDAQQVEEADQRNIPGHDDQHAARRRPERSRGRAMFPSRSRRSMSSAIAATARRTSAGVNQPLARQARSATSCVGASPPKSASLRPKAEKSSIALSWGQR